MHVPSLDSIPKELAERPQWVCWRTEQRNGKPTKVPYQPREHYYRASVTEPTAWGSLETALAQAHRFDGVGYVLSRDDPYAVADLDDCLQDGMPNPEAAAIVRLLDSYTEITPSGNGLRVIVRAKLPEGGCRKGKIELYDHDRYVTVTGRPLEGAPTAIEARQAELARLHAQVFGEKETREAAVATPPVRRLDSDLDILEVALKSENGPRVQALLAGDTTGYDSPSEADLALLNFLAFYSGGDAQAMDRIFRSSGLMRPKWDSRNGDTTWGAKQIAKALEGRTEFYIPSGLRYEFGGNGHKPPEPIVAASAPAMEQEGQVLGALILHADCRPAILAILRCDDIVDHSHRLVFATIARLHADSAPITVQTIEHDLQRRGDLEKAGGVDGLRRLMGLAANSSDANYWARQLAEAGKQRRLVASLEQALARAKGGRATEALAQVHLLAAEARRESLVKLETAGSTAAELWAKDIPKREPIVESLIYDGLSLLVGAGKIGKSFMALQLAVSVHNGGQALGMFKCYPCEVLYLPLEDGEGRLQGRLRILSEVDPGVRPEALTRLHFRYEWPMIGEGAEDAFATWLDKHPETRLILVDVFQKLRPPAKRNAGNAYQEDYQVLGPLQRFAQDRHIALVLLHHTNKLRAEDAYDSISGSTGLMSCADTTLLMRRNRNDPKGTLSVTGRDVEERKLAVRFEGGLWRCEGDAEELQRGETEQAVIDFLLGSGNEATGPATIATATGVTRQTTHSLLRRLSERGIVTPQPGGKYRLSDYFLASLGGEDGRTR